LVFSLRLARNVQYMRRLPGGGRDKQKKERPWMNFTEHTKIRKEKFGTVVFDTLTERIFVTDQAGGEILGLIEQGKDLPAIVSTLSDSYGGDPQQIEQDTAEFIAELKSNSIVSV
jgi:hypothetical protein